MRVVLDTNVLVAAAATRGACADLLSEVIRDHVFAVDENLLDELRRVLTTKLKVPPPLVRDFAAFVERHATEVAPTPLPAPVCRAPDGDRILALCAAFAADLLVTGDDDLLILEQYGPTAIVRPRDFWSRAAAAR